MVSPQASLLRRLSLSFLVLFGVVRLTAQTSQGLPLLNQGRVDEAAGILNSALAEQPHDALTHQLLCRVYYAQDLGDAAVRECEQATQDDASNSANWLWLGRAYGLKASQVNMLTAFGVARKVHAAFERAVQLDPGNVSATSDLGQFYVAAPAIVGGGTDKAEKLTAGLMARSPARGHRLLGQIAAKKDDLSTAEAEFKNAVASGKNPDSWVDLGLFYQQHAQPDKAVAALKSSIDANRKKTSALVDVASILTDLNRLPDVAEKCLRDYLASSAKTDDAPVFKVHVQLGDLLKRRGDLAGAKREYDAALALASKYAPAVKAAQGT